MKTKQKVTKLNNELRTQGKTVEEAVQRAANQLGVDVSSIEYEVITEPKKGFLGIGEVPATIRVVTKKNPADLALDFINTLLDNMSVSADVSMEDLGDGEKLIKIYGDDASVLIGHHGDTLDGLQYLCNLAANKKADENDDREYTRITVDIEDYRKRREATLRALARRMASKVLKYKRNIALEPMSAYERRIIHSEIQGIEGVTTNSIGQDSGRRVVITLDK